MFGGTLLVEVIFGWPGLGNLMVTAVRSGDMPIIQAATLVYCLGVLAGHAGGGRGLTSDAQSPAAAAMNADTPRLRLPVQGWVGGALLALLLVATAAAAPWIAPAPPNDMDLLSILLPPDRLADPPHWLGTDGLGRDVLSRVIWGARIALAVAVGAAAAGRGPAGHGARACWPARSAAAVGLGDLPPGGRLAVLPARGTVPVAAWWRWAPGWSSVVFAIVLVDWTRFCRVLRAEVMVIRQAGLRGRRAV